MGLSFYQWLIIIAFIGVLIWAFGPKRKGRFKKDGQIPLKTTRIKCRSSIPCFNIN